MTRRCDDESRADSGEDASSSTSEPAGCRVCIEPPLGVLRDRSGGGTMAPLGGGGTVASTSSSWIWGSGLSVLAADVRLGSGDTRVDGPAALGGAGDGGGCTTGALCVAGDGGGWKTGALGVAGDGGGRKTGALSEGGLVDWTFPKTSAAGVGLIAFFRASAALMRLAGTTGTGGLSPGTDGRR